MDIPDDQSDDPEDPQSQPWTAAFPEVKIDILFDRVEYDGLTELKKDLIMLYSATLFFKIPRVISTTEDSI